MRGLALFVLFALPAHAANHAIYRTGATLAPRGHCSSPLRAHLAPRGHCSSPLRAHLAPRGHCSSPPRAPIGASRPLFEPTSSLECTVRAHFEATWRLEGTVRARVVFERASRPLGASKARSNLLLEKCVALFCFARCCLALLHFTPCMDMHGFAIIYIYIYVCVCMYIYIYIYGRDGWK